MVIYFLEAERITMLKSVNVMMSKVQRIQELRRSNAAQPVRNKKKYSRKTKHKRRVDLTD